MVWTEKMNSRSSTKAKSCDPDTKNMKKVKTAHQTAPKPRTKPPQNHVTIYLKNAHQTAPKTRTQTPQNHVTKVDKQRKQGDFNIENDLRKESKPIMQSPNYQRTMNACFIAYMVQAVSQWASLFAEKGLGVTKTIGDLAGPMSFAMLMGTSRLLYGKYGEKWESWRQSYFQSYYWPD